MLSSVSARAWLERNCAIAALRIYIYVRKSENVVYGASDSVIMSAKAVVWVRVNEEGRLPVMVTLTDNPDVNDLINATLEEIKLDPITLDSVKMCMENGTVLKQNEMVSKLSTSEECPFVLQLPIKDEGLSL